MIYFSFFNCHFLLKNSQETVIYVPWLSLVSIQLNPPSRTRLNGLIQQRIPLEVLL